MYCSRMSFKDGHIKVMFTDPRCSLGIHVYRVFQILTPWWDMTPTHSNYKALYIFLGPRIGQSKIAQA